MERILRFQLPNHTKGRTMRDTLKIVAIVIAACAIPGLASAELDTVTEKVTVSYGELDLTNESGRKTLYRRLKAAAGRVCGSTQLRIVGSVSRIAENRTCYNEAMADALDSLAMPAVSRLHNGGASQTDITLR